MENLFFSEPTASQIQYMLGLRDLRIASVDVALGDTRSAIVNVLLPVGSCDCKKGNQTTSIDIRTEWRENGKRTTPLKMELNLSILCFTVSNFDFGRFSVAMEVWSSAPRVVLCDIPFGPL